MKAPAAMDFLQPRRNHFWGARSTGMTRWAAVLALALGAGGVFMGIYTAWSHLDTEQQIKQRVEHTQGRIDALSPRRPAPLRPASAQDIERQARIIHQLNLPWADVLSTLEQMRPDGVALVSMEPAGAGALRLQVESLSLDRSLAYAADLQSAGPFGALTYTRHETNERDPNRPVRLSFEISLKGRATP